MKKIILSITVLALCSITAAFAQFTRPISVGLGGGTTINLTDLANVEARFAGHIEVDGLITPFISVGLRGEKGWLSGHGHLSEFENDYYGLQANGKIRLGQFLPLPDNYSYYTLKASTLSRIASNIYIGAGAGFIKNNIENQISSIYYDAVTEQGGELTDDLNGMQFVVPIHVGVDIPLGRTLYGPQWAINVNYQHSLTTADNLDGVINNKKDHYGYVSIGVKYGLFHRQ